MRYAVYLTPPHGSPLLERAEAWLGRSALSGAVGEPAAPHQARVAAPARYGFHATMRAPFSLAPGVSEADLIARFRAFAAEQPPLEVTLEIAELGHFVALEAIDHAPVAAAAEAVVRAFESARAPLDEADRARRSPGLLDARGRELLDAWGYPFVMERFVFHMTLSGSIEAVAVPAVTEAAAAHFDGLLGVPHRLVYAIFREDEPKGPFSIIATQDDLGE
ncbi:DUF1045 domain-containing protein [Acuticoccus sp. M5D2P5]|uniref:DUF1045 domain-containing protein n=1 Tax=Acuticoccus kalidii TaxID=2910977 RepID=UPI001F2D231A|nr:DUF1045 domain-containing protein [Acuticoccus kalidii]MCF3933556.1 DUF1045 domain-containing protein [Acuticoccus kalidii]